MFIRSRSSVCTSMSSSFRERDQFLLQGKQGELRATTREIPSVLATGGWIAQRQRQNQPHMACFRGKQLVQDHVSGSLLSCLYSYPWDCVKIAKWMFDYELRSLLFPIESRLTLRGYGGGSQNCRLLHFANDERAYITSEHRVQINVFTAWRLEANSRFGRRD